jgi:hypothetical protein
MFRGVELSTMSLIKNLTMEKKKLIKKYIYIYIYIGRM